MRQLITILFTILFISCNGQNSKQKLSKNQLHQIEKNAKERGQLKDATVEYSNPHTGTHSTYKLKVLVLEDKLICIYWRSGGYLDTHHFIAPDISDGDAEFTTDKGLNYKVILN